MAVYLSENLSRRSRNRGDTIFDTVLKTKLMRDENASMNVQKCDRKAFFGQPPHGCLRSYVLKKDYRASQINSRHEVSHAKHPRMRNRAILSMRTEHLSTTIDHTHSAPELPRKCAASISNLTSASIQSLWLSNLRSDIIGFQCFERLPRHTVV